MPIVNRHSDSHGTGRKLQRMPFPRQPAVPMHHPHSGDRCLLHRISPHSPHSVLCATPPFLPPGNFFHAHSSWPRLLQSADGSPVSASACVLDDHHHHSIIHVRLLSFGYRDLHADSSQVISSLISAVGSM